MRLAHEDTLIAWSQERGAQVRGAVDTTLFSVDVGDDAERLEFVAGGCELRVRSRGPFRLLATKPSVVAAEKYLFYTRAVHRRIALGFPRWSNLRVGDPIAAGVTITWRDTTTTMSWPESHGLETITFFYPKASAAVTLSHLVQMPVVISSRQLNRQQPHTFWSSRRVILAVSSFGRQNLSLPRQTLEGTDGPDDDRLSDTRENPGVGRQLWAAGDVALFVTALWVDSAGDRAPGPRCDVVAFESPARSTHERHGRDRRLGARVLR